MAEDKKNPGIQTVYDGADAGLLAFDSAGAVAGEIQGYLGMVQQLQIDFKEEPAVCQGLREIESKLQTLRFSKEPQAEIQKKLQALVQVPLGPDKSIRLDAFRKTAAKKEVGGAQDYLERVRKLVRNTLNNTTLLLVAAPEDSILQQLLKDLGAMDLKGEVATLKPRLEAFGKSPQLWHYNEKKKAFLVEWLKPFQGALDKPIEAMTEEQFQDALRKVEGLRETKLKEVAQLVVDPNRDPFKPHNRTMQAVMNGKFKDFWGTTEVRDEFIKLMNQLILRFSFNLEDRFLLFKSQDGGFMYLVGFADEAFDNTVTMQDGRLGLYPHLKVFLNRSGEFQEITPGNYTVNKQAYYRALKTAVVPFFVSISRMLELQLSDELKSSFDMWT